MPIPYREWRVREEKRERRKQTLQRAGFFLFGFLLLKALLWVSGCGLPTREGDLCRPVEGECCSDGVLLRCEGDDLAAEHPRLVAYPCTDPGDQHTHFCRCTEPAFAEQYPCRLSW